MKVLTVVGTRPEIIRLSRVIALLDESVDHVLANTGQNFDPNLNQNFFGELGIRDPNYSFNVDSSSLGSMLADILRSTESVIASERPDAFLVLGDTNSALSSLMAKRVHVPVYHMEAGNRSFDENVPEETNRRIIDHLSDFNLAYTEHARRNLIAEGIHPRKIMVTGSPMREVLTHYEPDIAQSRILERMDLIENGYLLVSAHRQETVDNAARLELLLESMRAAAREWDLPVIVSTHPRTRDRLEKLGQYAIDNVHFCDPFGFFDFCRLQSMAFCVVSDSGTISEEASILGFPAVSPRSSIERPEAIDTGSIIVSGLQPVDVLAGIEAAVSGYSTAMAPLDYLPSDTSVRVRNFLLSTAHEHRAWAGLH